MFQILINAFKNKEIRAKIFITLLLLLIYRVGCWIPVPGLNIAMLETVDNNNTFLSLLNGITGSALSNGALLALGISPYINASIIAQLLGIAIPALERWSKQGDEGKRKTAMFTRVLTVILALIQAIGIAVSFSAQKALTFGENSVFPVAINEFVGGIFVVVMLVAGSVFTMWLGEKITDHGIGNGISFIIFTGIISTAGIAIVASLTAWITGIKGVNTGDPRYQPWFLLFFLLLVVVIFGFIAFIDGAERKISVQYAKQVKGRKMYGGQSTHIPIKVNASGVLPIIFATAIVTFPQLIMQLFMGGSTESNWYLDLFGSGQPLYFVFCALLILGFSYFYSSIQFKPDEVARTLQQNGGFVPGTRPGKPTADLFKRVNNRLTFFGAMYLTTMFIVPSLVFSILSLFMGEGFQSALVNAFTSTGMLIVVSVALEIQKQLETQLLTKQYKGFLNK